ncbi:MAG: chloride channel protein [Thermoplasmatota archaeon]
MLVTRRFTALNGAALLVGVVVGLAAVGFRGLINGIENLAFRGDWGATAREENEFLTTEWGLLVFLVPAVGGVVVGFVRYLFPELRRQGIAEVMAAVQARGGIIKGRTSWGQAFISGVTVGTGGSTGREGPIGFIGAAIGSSLGRRFGFKARDIKVLLACGVSAGIAATFNAPLGGVLFALELILPEFSTHAFIPVVTATVIGVTVAHRFLGDTPAFIVPEFTLVSPWELGFYLVLGLLCGFGGVGFIKLLGRASDLGERLPVPFWTKPAIGGLFVGLLGLGLFLATGHFELLGGEGHYHIFGTGYASVSAILTGESFMLLVPMLLLLLVAKPVASSITIGSGGGGGVFSSSLFQGAVYGGLVGVGANALWPEMTAPAGAYALVGMGAFYASTGRATLTTIVLMSELTNGYTIVLPLMFAAVTADAISISLSPDSIYTTRLTKRGIVFDHDRTQSPLDSVCVSEVMTKEVDCLAGDVTVADAFSDLLNLGHNGLPVLDEAGDLVGVVTRSDLSRHLGEGHGDRLLRDIVSGDLVTAYPHERLFRARDRLFEHDIGRLLVVDPKDKHKLVGILTRTDLLRAEARLDVEHTDSWTRRDQG